MKNEVIFEVGDKVIFYKDEHTRQRGFTTTFQTDRALNDGYTLEVTKVYKHTDPYFVVCDHKTFNNPYTFDPRDLKLIKEDNLLSKIDLTHDISLGVNPDYYKSESIEVIDFIQAYNLNFSRGNVVKYITRAGKKDADMQLEDLEKAKKYLEFEIDRIKKAQDGPKVKRELDR